MQASQPGKKKHQVLVVGCELETKGFVTREEDSRWSLFEPSRKLQRKKKRKGDQGPQRLTRS